MRFYWGVSEPINWIVETANSANWHLQLFKYITFISIIIQEEFEESKEVLIIRKLKERQRNGQKKQGQRDKQRSTKQYT
jgi:hypothetical protein